MYFSRLKSSLFHFTFITACVLTTSAPVNSFFSFCGMRGLVNPIILMMKEGGNSTGKSQPIVKISKPQFSLVVFLPLSALLDVNKFNQLQLFVRARFASVRIV